MAVMRACVPGIMLACLIGPVVLYSGSLATFVFFFRLSFQVYMHVQDVQICFIVCLIINPNYWTWIVSYILRNGEIRKCLY